MTLSRQLPLDIKLRPDATFANYIGEAGRRLQAMHGVVFLWGEPGSGRSHLLQAACHEANHSGNTSIYLTELAGHAPALIERLESFDLVCIDDIDALAGVEEWETALFHLINSVRDAGKTLILSAASRANTLGVRLPDLKSRLIAAGQVVTDHLTDDEKLMVLRERARREGFAIPDEVCRFILSRSSRDMSSLLALMDKLEVETLRQQKKVTIPFVKQVLGMS
ncbi:MAG: DnaA regulatory inactivator Hda [Pseudomonadales bacterium]|nr:DnaA regulatory inactivator Hda [Pseudomonadales bacterium]